MNTKTSQLQIRVSPAEKATLKRLAREADLSLSEYVLSRALPSETLELARHVQVLVEATDRNRALEDLATYLRSLPAPGFAEVLASADLAGLSPLLRNCVAGSVEREATRKGVSPPRWVEDVLPLSRPNFARELASLRPHLMRLTPPVFKRRRVFTGALHGARDRRLVMASTSRRGGPASSQPDEARRHLTLLAGELATAGVQAELSVAGGAVMRLAFHAAPASRRPRDMFASVSELDAAMRRIARDERLPDQWLHPDVRALVGAGPLVPTHGFLDEPSLSVLAPPPDYLLAMKCAQMHFSPDGPQEAEDDLRYLLRYMDIGDVDSAMTLVAAYLNERQRPPDLAARLEELRT